MFQDVGVRAVYDGIEWFVWVGKTLYIFLASGLAENDSHRDGDADVPNCGAGGWIGRVYVAGMGRCCFVCFFFLEEERVSE